MDYILNIFLYDNDFIFLCQVILQCGYGNQQPRRERRGIKPSYNKVIELSCIIWVK